MNRKSLIFCLAALAVMILGIGVAVAFLYSGVEGTGSHGKVRETDSRRSPVLCAVPSDAILVAVCREAGMSPVSVKAPSALSLHYYAGKLHRLHVIDMEDCPDMTEDACREAENKELYTGVVGNLLLISDSETLLRSSQRHLDKNISILDASGFQDAVNAVEGENLLYISNSHFGKLLPSVLSKSYSSYSGFMERLADWCVFDVTTTSEVTSLTGTLLHDTDVSDFMNVLELSRPSSSAVSEILPSYTLFAASLPMKDMDAYVSAYKSYLDSRQKLQLYLAAQDQTGFVRHPMDLLRKWGVREVATASFKTGSVLETVNLMKVTSPELSTLFLGTEISSMKGYYPVVHDWAYPSLLSSVFGDFFARKDESCFTYIDGWVVTGSRDAVEEYASGRALEYTLKQYMSDAGQQDLLAENSSSFVAYFSFSETEVEIDAILRKGFIKEFGHIWDGAEYAPAVLTVGGGRRNALVSLDMRRLTLKKTKAPAFERDTVVIVPKGPFDVKNSGTGKMNMFYQNSHNSICLNQDGKDLWGVPFDRSICGRAGTVDYFANGKLQILFCAGDKLYLIDRLGRYVNGFPRSLGREVLLGPDIYDFNGARKYNVMILHKDNVIEMYNLKGQKPAAWKGITAQETIKNLPERIFVGGNSFWVVRTSIQTLIFPFYGGDPLTSYTGNQMIRPDSEVRAVDDATVEFACYDGKVRTLKLK